MKSGHAKMAASVAGVLLLGSAIPFTVDAAFSGEGETPMVITFDPDAVESSSEAEKIVKDAEDSARDEKVAQGGEADDAQVAPVKTAHGVDAETLCLAKIVHHESANQPRNGQLAVAQVVMNRVGDPRFAKTICGVALQRGQFFNVNAYNPSRDPRWQNSIAIALDARNKVSAPVVGKALFFHAAWAKPSFFKSRTRVRQIGDHVFYS